MFGTQKRLWALLSAILLPTLAALWGAVINQQGGLVTKYPSLRWAYVATVLVVAAAVAYYTQVRPGRSLEGPLLKLLDIAAKQPLALGTANGINPRMNVMLADRPWHLLGKARLRIVWGVGMNGFPDVNSL